MNIRLTLGFNHSTSRINTDWKPSTRLLRLVTRSTEKLLILLWKHQHQKCNDFSSLVYSIRLLTNVQCKYCNLHVWNHVMNAKHVIDVTFFFFTPTMVHKVCLLS